jgi:outer membrane protein TolC
MTAVRRLILLTCAAAAYPLLAQTSVAPAANPQTTEVQRSTPPVTADTDADLTSPRALKLSLDEAIRTSLKENLGVDLQRYDYAETAESLRGSYSIFDIYTNAQLQTNSDEAATTSTFQSSSQKQTFANAQAQQTLPTGGFYNLGVTNSRDTTSGGGTSLNPSYRTGLSLTFTQPLARNFGMDVTRRNITLARNNLGISRELFRSAVLDTANLVEQAYLDLVYSRQYVDVVKESVFLARDQSRITQIRIDVGASAPLDILQPRVQIATSEENLIVAVANVRAAEDRLRGLMNLPPSDWDRPIVPSDRISYAPTTINVESAIAKAYELRPEIKENELTIANRRVTYNYARNQILPQFDAVVNYNANGAAGRAVNPQTGQPIVGGTSTRYFDAAKQVLQGDFPGWSVGVNVGIPIFNIGARAEARRAELDLQRSNVSDTQTRQNIALDVRANARTIDTAAKEISASGAARDAAEKNLDAERKRYENGMTTNFQVLQIQQQLSDARARELQALVSYNKALAAFHRSVGDLLDVRSITLEEPMGSQEPSMFTRFDRYNWLNFAAHDTDAQNEAKEQKK